MENLNIKEYLQINDAPKIKKSEPVVYIFEKVFDNGSDFVIERSTKKGFKRQLCFIANENLLFIRDPKTNKDKKIISERQIKDFFQNDVEIRNLKFNNNFFNKNSVSEFSYEILKLHRESRSIRRDLIKYGINATDFLQTPRWGSDKELDALDEEGIDKVLKVVKIVQEYYDLLSKKDGDYKNQVNAEFILFLCRIQNLYTIDYVRIFLDIFTNYDSKFYPVMSNYVSYQQYGEWKCLSFEKPLEDFNLDFRRYCTYIFRDLYSQGISEIDANILETYYDCLHLQKEMYGKIKDKYPEHFRECHDKTTLIYNINQEYFKERKIEALNNLNKQLEWSTNEYSVICAKTSEDLITEGINLHHCVGSYVDRVKNGECSIFFLRKTDDLDTSLVTLEIIENKIIQARGLCERFMTFEEKGFIMNWCSLKGLKLVSE